MKIHFIYASIAEDGDAFEDIEKDNVGFILDLDYIPRVNELIGIHSSLLKEEFIKKIINCENYKNIKDRLEKAIEMIFDSKQPTLLFEIKRVMYVINNNINDKNIVIYITLHAPQIKIFTDSM